ncbi:MAG: hypothetical protein H0T89_00890 [Deltaproteobacteria bacterium]|nr:hypothetical protein [Deltaproteobacteria bacterium]MDQ3300755.1 hypothetical protein [Myxococcota bacterium]
MLLAFVVASIVAWIALEGAASPAEPHARLPRELATGMTLLAVHVTAIGEHLARDATSAGVLGMLGVLAIAGGIALRISAIRTLGARFVSTTLAPDRRVTSGPYRWLRHPSEVGLLAAAAGTAAALGSIGAAAITIAVLVPLSLVRCADEDSALGVSARDERSTSDCSPASRSSPRA